ncbi:MAG: hypothetical protein D3904_12535 [Candidatus Electrothrix sp. EH2]|nr:hypothetical protein [Candidatus Electrothrix sp. EH2]
MYDNRTVLPFLNIVSMIVAEIRVSLAIIPIMKIMFHQYGRLETVWQINLFRGDIIGTIGKIF